MEVSLWSCAHFRFPSDPKLGVVVVAMLCKRGQWAIIRRICYSGLDSRTRW